MAKKKCPGSKIRSKGRGRGLGRGKGKGPIGRPSGGSKMSRHRKLALNPKKKKKAKKMAKKRADVKIYRKSGRPVIIVAKASTAKGKKVIAACKKARKARGGLTPMFNGGLCCKPAHAESVRKMARKMGATTKTIAVK